MRKPTSLLEWQIVNDQESGGYAPWPPTVETTPSALATHRRSYRRYVRGGLLALLLLLASAGGWLWHTAQIGVAQIEGELQGAVQMELASVAPVSAALAVIRATESAAMVWESQLEREREILNKALPSELSEAAPNTTVHTTSQQDDLAVTNFVMTATDGTQAYRQTRFYRHTAGGWLRTKPVADLWGAPRHLKSAHFIFRFRQNDAEVVAAVAPQIDALYTNLYRNFGLTPSGESLVIEVTVEHVTGASAAPRWPHEPLVVPSPAVYFAPVELTDSEILAQSIALPLIEYIEEQAVEDYAIPLHWRPLLRGLTLWQVWDVEMPLATWRHDVVKWLYRDVPMAGSEQHSVLPERYTELCAMHGLWMLSPATAGIPLACTKSEPITWSQSRRLDYILRPQLDQLHMPQLDREQLYDMEENYFYGSHEMVAVATLVEYAVAAYDYEQLPVLLAGLAQYNNWDSLIPAVYGLSSSEFEKGWQAHMVKEYGPQPNLVRP